MKKVILLLLLASSFGVKAQSLKEALYSGKLKNEPGTVIRKGDDLSTKMDTARKATPDTTAKILAVAPATDTTAKKPTVAVTNITIAATTESKETSAAVAQKDNAIATVDSAAAVVTTAPPADAPKDANALARENTATWKAHATNVINTLKAEVLPAKKVKKDSYFITVTYVIGTEGQVDVTDVTVSPENSFLQQQVKDRISVDVPKMNPVVGSNGVPRKTTKRYNFTLTKE